MLKGNKQKEKTKLYSDELINTALLKSYHSQQRMKEE